MGTEDFKMKEMPEVSRMLRTGYVIELDEKRYFSGWRAKRICTGIVERARYFSKMGQAERYARQKLGFIGLRIHICRVCWTLVETESLEDSWRLIKEKGDAVRFSTYEEAKNYQRENSLWRTTMIERSTFREKDVSLAA